MEARYVPNLNQAARGRAGPPIGVLVCLLALVPVSGCFRHWLSKSNHTAEPLEAVTQYYQDAVDVRSAPYNTGVPLEVPSGAPPRTASNPEADEVWEMTLREAIELALENSQVVRQIRNGIATAVASSREPAIAETRIQEELGRFDSSLIFNLFWNESEEQLNNNISPSGILASAGSVFKQDTFGGVAGRGTGLPGSGDLLSLRKPLRTGGEIVFGFNTDYTFPNLGTRLFRSAFESRVFTQFRQPLLRNAGVDVNGAPIIVARLRADQSLWNLRQSISELVRDVEQKYWELAASQVQYWANNQAIETNLEIVRQLKLKVDQGGTANKGELDEANLQLQQLRRQRVLALSDDTIPGSRIGGVLAVERQLRGLLGIEPFDGKRIVAVDEPLVAPLQFDWSSLLTEAFQYHPDIQGLKLQVAQQSQAILIARNGLLPRVDLFARGELQGLGDGFDDSIDQLTDGKFGSVTYGVQAEYSFGYRRESAAYQRAMQEYYQTIDILRDKGREIWETLGQSLQQVDKNSRLYDISVTARQVAESRLETQGLLYAHGQITLDRLLDAVRAYADAVNNEFQDKAQFQSALASLELAKGTILRHNNIQLVEEPWAAAAYPQAAQQEQDRRRAIPSRHLRSTPRPYHPEPIQVIESREYPEAQHTEPDAIPVPEPEPAAPADSNPFARQSAAVGPKEIPLELPIRKHTARKHGDEAVQPVLWDPSGPDSAPDQNSSPE
jgi:outer membrane protein TolC